MDTQNAQTSINQPTISSSSVPGVMDLVRETITIFRSRIKLYLPFYTIMFVGSVLYSFMTQTANTTPFNMPTYWLLFFLYLACNYYATISLIINLHEPTLHIDEVYKRANNRLLPYIGTTFLSGIIIMLGLIMLIIPGILFSFWFYLVPYVVLLENLSGRAALSRSKEYMKGEGWYLYFKGFWAIILISLPLILLSIGMGGISEVINIKQMFVANVLFIALGSMVSVVSGALSTIVIYLIYSYTRKRTPHSTIEPQSTSQQAVV